MSLSEDSMSIFFGDDPGESTSTAKSPANENKPQDKYFEADIYKKWFKAGSRSGFISIRGWLEVGKVSVDIGEVSNNQPMQSTKVWCDAVQLAAYLKAISTSATAANIYKDEVFTYYGGAKVDGKPVSRILKVSYWGSGNQNSTVDKNAFSWKAGHFEASESSSGAFLPNMKASISQNMIKVTRQEMLEISYRLDLALMAFAFSTPDFFQGLNGGSK